MRMVAVRSGIFVTLCLSLNNLSVIRPRRSSIYYFTSA